MVTLLCKPQLQIYYKYRKQSIVGIPTLALLISQKLFSLIIIVCPPGNGFSSVIRECVPNTGSLIVSCIPNDQYLSHCICIDKYRWDDTLARCVSCVDSNCLKCDTAANTCDTCTSAYALTTSFTCLRKCHQNCLACTSIDMNSCSKCEVGFYLNGTTCDSKCPDGYYPSSTSQVCLKCDSSCSTCSSSATQCTKCVTGYFRFSTSTTCSPTCPDNYYGDIPSGTCQPCNALCETCYDSTNLNCPICNTIAFKFSSLTCLESCPLGYRVNSTSKTCIKCHSNCLTCYDSSDRACLICSDSHQYTISGICLNCNSACATCNGPNNIDCTSCYPGAALFPNKTCINLNCQTGTYADSATISCLNCPSECSSCLTYTNCTGCISGFLLEDQTCQSCASRAGYYLGSSGECLEVCGDSRNLGLNECDDGNTNDEDGCSSQCKVEVGWVCTPMGVGLKDICNLQSNINVTFKGNTIKTANIYSMQIQIQASGQGISIQKDWEVIANIYRLKDYAVVNYYTLKIDAYNYNLFLEYTPDLYKESELFVIRQNSTGIQDQSGNQVYIKPQTVQVYFDTSNRLDFTTAQEGVGFTIGSMLFIIILIGDNHLVWKIFAHLQEIFFYSLIQVTYPKFVKEYLNLMRFADFEWVVNPIQSIANLANAELESAEQIPPPKFVEYQINTQFFLNSGKYYFSILCWIGIKYFVKFINYKFNAKTRKLNNLVSTETFLLAMLNFHFLFAVGSNLQVAKLNFGSAFTGLSSFLAIFQGAFLIFSLFAMGKFIDIASKENLKRDALVRYYKEKNGLTKKFSIIFVIHRYVIAFALVFAYKQPHAQIGIIFLMKAGFAIMTATSKPYFLRAFNWVYGIADGLSALFLVSVFMMHAFEDQNSVEDNPGLFGILCGIMAIALSIYIIFLLVVEMLKVCSTKPRVEQQQFAKQTLAVNIKEDKQIVNRQLDKTNFETDRLAVTKNDKTFGGLKKPMRIQRRLVLVNQPKKISTPTVPQKKEIDVKSESVASSEY